MRAREPPWESNSLVDAPARDSLPSFGDALVIWIGRLRLVGNIRRAADSLARSRIADTGLWGFNARRRGIARDIAGDIVWNTERALVIEGGGDGEGEEKEKKRRRDQQNEARSVSTLQAEGCAVQSSIVCRTPKAESSVQQKYTGPTYRPSYCPFS